MKLMLTENTSFENVIKRPPVNPDQPITMRHVLKIAKILPRRIDIFLAVFEAVLRVFFDKMAANVTQPITAKIADEPEKS